MIYIEHSKQCTPHKCSDQRAVQTLSSHLRFLQSQHFKSLSSSEIMEDELTFPFLVFVARQSICAEFPFLASSESIYHTNFQITAEKLTLCCFGTCTLLLDMLEKWRFGKYIGSLKRLWQGQVPIMRTLQYIQSSFNQFLKEGSHNCRITFQKLDYNLLVFKSICYIRVRVFHYLSQQFGLSAQF